MIHLFYSNRTDRLIGALMDHLRPEEEDLLDPVTIIVPSLPMATHLKHRVAAQSGIAANLQLLFLEKYLRTVAEEAGAENVLGMERLQAILLRALVDERFLDQPDLAPVREYIDAGGDDGRARDLRRFQLSTHLARHLDGYILTRAEMLERWNTGPLFGETPQAKTEAWQRAIWNGLRPQITTITDAFASLSPSALRLPRRLHFFDVELAAPGLQGILAKLSAATEVFIYALNPCLEFWEDVLANFEVRGLEQRLALDFDAESAIEEDTPALRLWGRPGRENVRLLNALTDCDYEGRFDPPTQSPRSLLHQLQQDVLLREPERTSIDADFDFEDDPSIRLLACPGLRREVEVIAQEIWAAVKRTPDLRFNEIAVVLAGRDVDAYRAHIAAVFEEAHEIPHNFLQVPLLTQSRIVEAIELLLDLPHSKFTRQKLLRLITHPAVIATVDGADPEEWLHWADELTILHGADRIDHENTYIERDLYNWEQGLLRLVLGTFMSGQRSGDDRVFSPGDQAYLPYEYPVDRLSSAASLTVLVRSLISDARFAERKQMPLEDWARFLRAMVDAYVAPTDDTEKRDLFRCVSAIDAIAELDPGGPDVSYTIAAETVRAKLGRLATNVGTPLAEGVVVAPLSLAHSLPFRVVFLAGMGEGRFPTSDRKSQLDLRNIKRRRGDVSPRERDQYRFLQMLLLTEDALRISWVSRDPQSGEDLMPSPVVVELKQMLERGYVRGGLTEQHPLRRYREPAEELVAPSSAREAQVLDLKEDLRRHLQDPQAAMPLLSLRRELPRELWSALAERMRLVQPRHRPDERTALTIRYEALRRFLEDPLQGWARFVLELSDEEQEDPFSRSDEIFTTGIRTGTLELRRVLIEKFRIDSEQDLMTDLSVLYQARADRLELEGRLPTGIFGQAERAKHERVLRAWQKQVRDALNGQAHPIDPVRFGRAHERADRAEMADPIALEVGLGDRTVLVEIHGSTQPLLRGEVNGSVGLSMMRPSKRSATRYELRGFVDQVVLAATGRADDVPFITASAFSEDALQQTSFLPFQKEEARNYLRTLVADLLSRPHAYLLPFATVLELHRAKRDGRLGPKRLQMILSRARPDRYGPLMAPRVATPTAEEIDDILENRFGPYFEKRRG